MDFLHLSYHVWVKDYHWTAKKVRVQSPVLDLERATSPPVFRPREGNNQNEPRIASRTDDLSDGIRGAEYLTEAHGIFIQNEPRCRYIPLWVTYQQSSGTAEGGQTAFVDLRSNVSRSGPLSRICWVPSHRTSDGKLYTIIGGTRVWRSGRRNNQNTVVCVQEEALPEKARFVWLSSDELSRLEPLKDMEKRRLFDMHLNIILTNRRPLSEIQRIVFRIATSPRSIDNGRRALRSILHWDLKSYLSWPYGSGYDPLEIEEYYDDDSDSEQETEAAYQASRSARPQQNSKCRTCNYPGLHPTRLNPFPEHFHGEDRDCLSGSRHNKHCIRAAHSPNECVIPLDEPHIHCNSPRLMLTGTDDEDNDDDNDEPSPMDIDTLLDAVDEGEGDNEFTTSLDSPLRHSAYPSPALVLSPAPPPEIPLDPDTMTEMAMEMAPLGPLPDLDYQLTAFVEPPTWFPCVDTSGFATPEPPDLMT